MAARLHPRDLLSKPCLELTLRVSSAGSDRASDRLPNPCRTLTFQLQNALLVLTARDSPCRELFTAEGNEFYIFPAARYIHQDETLDFYQLLARGRMRQEASCLSLRPLPIPSMIPPATPCNAPLSSLECACGIPRVIPSGNSLLERPIVCIACASPCSWFASWSTCCVMQVA